MCFNWLTDVIVTLLTTVLGAAVSLLGVVITLKNEQKALKKERIEKIKPILINYTCAFSGEESVIPKYKFVSDGKKVEGTITGMFKNTDNGILFFDKIITESKTYFPHDNSTVDKNTVFLLELDDIAGESLKSCRIYCQDILGNKYYYDAEFVFDITKPNELIIGNIQTLEEHLE